jgi:hypothetical protein
LKGLLSISLQRHPLCVPLFWFLQFCSPKLGLSPAESGWILSERRHRMFEEMVWKSSVSKLFIAFLNAESSHV